MRCYWRTASSLNKIQDQVLVIEPEGLVFGANIQGFTDKVEFYIYALATMYYQQ